MAYEIDPIAKTEYTLGQNMNIYGDEESASKYAATVRRDFKDAGLDQTGDRYYKRIMGAWKNSAQRDQDALAAEIYEHSKGLFKPGEMARLRIRTPEEFRLSNGGVNDPLRIPLTSTQEQATRATAQMLTGGLNIPVG